MILRALLLALFLPLLTASADVLDEILARGELRWGADQSGGAPYVFEGPDGKITGFESELAALLAKDLGVRPSFVQGPWDKLPNVLDRGDIDVVLNGYEWTPEREAAWSSSVPYYVYTLQWMARADDKLLSSWQDLRRPLDGRKPRVGVLAASAAERFAREHLGDVVQILSFDGVTNAMRLVEQGQLEATLQDLPIAACYGPQFPALRRLGEPVAPGHYVALVRKGDQRLKDRIDQAVLKAVRNGGLKQLYERYGIWTPEQEGLEAAAAHWPPASGTVDEGIPLGRWAGLLLGAAGTTVALSFLSMPLAMALGLAVALGRLYGPRWADWPLGGYVEFLRGTPLLLQLFVIYYLLPNVGLRIPAFWAGVLGLAINYSAYEAENYRAGLLAVPRGQMEAALSLGMGSRDALRRVIVPQAVRMVIPPVTNDFIALFKDTSVCSVIAVTELTGMYNRLYNNNPRRVLELGMMTALLYLMMSYPLSLLARRLERRLKGPA